ncbi:MAG: hypothetical protein E4G91_08420 [Candidatus Zixiibacteriota bacterium]|nr:MAG: hypothetical protein E4G91_08420 [candidate division Zixibacteria bacterium]
MGEPVPDAKKITFRVLSDEPTDHDEFGSHQRIAAAIADIIENDHKGTAIALTGSWGSGKSSVIKMLSDKLHGVKDGLIATVVFDAWSHSGDPLRRAFFESLVDTLDATGWLKREDWKKSLNRLARREWTETTTTRPRLKAVSIIYAILVSLVPIGLTLTALHKSWIWFPLKQSVTFWLGLIFAIAPPVLLIVAFLIYVILRIISKDHSEVFLGRLSPFLSTAEMTTEKDVYQTPDPTSLEFQSEYRKVMTDVLSDKDRKIVFVIDNLDRVGQEEAKTIWTTMRTFLENDQSSHADWSERIWLIVPFDVSGIERLWSDLSDSLAGQFNEKTFQITFRLPEPVLDDWTKYFEEQCRRAFPDFSDEEEAQAVCTVFRLMLYPSLKSPTPRHIKTFLNRLGANYVQRGAEFPMRLLALYATAEAQGGFKIADILKKEDHGGIFHPLPKDFFGEDCVESLAAIHYGVPKNKAMHVMLEPIIEEAITLRKSRRCSEIK